MEITEAARDVHVGEVRRVSIVDLKKQYPDLTTEDIKEIEDKGANGILYNRSHNAQDSSDSSYVYVLYFEYKTFNNQVYKIKDTSTGGSKVIKKDPALSDPIQ